MKDQKLPNQNNNSVESYIESFESLISHELRTPLTIIKSYLWMVLAGKAGNLEDGQKSYINKALYSTEKLLTMVNNFIEFLQLEKGGVRYDKSNINIVDLAKQVATEYTDMILDRNLSLNIESDHGNIMVMADPEKLRKVFKNLMESLIKYSKTGSIKINIEESDREVLVMVRGSDPDLNKSDFKKLFKKFQTTNEDKTDISDITDTSLGFFISRSYILGMGGKTKVESMGEGKGSTLMFVLPKE